MLVAVLLAGVTAGDKTFRFVEDDTTIIDPHGGRRRIARGSATDLCEPDTVVALEFTTATASDIATSLAELPRSDRYEIVGTIGSGGMGEVLTARDIPLARDVVVKRMRTATPSPESVTRFLREARIQGQLQHPAIVPVHELAVDANGRPFFAMKQLAAVTLADILARGDAAVWSRPRLLRAFIDVCLATELAHTRGVVHRDLKPSNVALGDFGEVYVLDWGVARILGGPDTLDRPLDDDEVQGLPPNATLPGSILGTPGYMAPEQLRGDPSLGPAADIYSLGCILFELLAGEPLHARSGPLASTVVGADARPSLRAPGRDVSPELDAICMRATEALPGDRFSSARSLADAVQRYLDGDRDVARRRELAANHLVEARAVIASGDSEDHRRVAVRAAGRALALDPESIEAADLVSHLVLSPPTVTPAEVRAAIEAKDARVARDHARLAAAAVAMFVLFLPLFHQIGIRDWTYVALAYVVVAANTALFFAQSCLRVQTTYLTWIGVAGACVQLAMFSRFFGGPFVLPTGLATAATAMSVMHPNLMKRAWVIVVAFVLAALAPWGLELAGVLAPTYSASETGFVLTSNILDIDPVLGQLTIAAYMVGAIVTIGVLSTRMARHHREIRDRLELQAWHLRQLVPATHSRRAL